MFVFSSIDDVQIAILEKLFSEGEVVSTRELSTLEVCNLNFCLTNPLNRITYNSKRKWRLALAIGEFAWHVSGSNNLDFITYYAKQWQNFSDDGKFISQSCYGHKIFATDENGDSQWTRLIDLLNIDKFSRRAVLDFYSSNDGLSYFAKDIACACSMQFLIRNNHLDAIVTMRSNDIIWGLPYDVYLFTMLQELLALELNVELGRYYHNVGSMHIYDRHHKLGKEMLAEKAIVEHPTSMEEITSLKSFLHYEELIRVSSVSVNEIDDLTINDYWRNLLLHLVNYKAQKMEQKVFT